MNHIGTASTQKLLHMCSLCLYQWRVPQSALKYPCNPPPPPPGDRHLATVSPPHPGDRRTLPWEIQGGRGVVSMYKSLVGTSEHSFLAFPSRLRLLKRHSQAITHPPMGWCEASIIGLMGIQSRLFWDITGTVLEDYVLDGQVMPRV